MSLRHYCIVLVYILCSLAFSFKLPDIQGQERILTSQPQHKAALLKNIQKAHSSTFGPSVASQTSNTAFFESTKGNIDPAAFCYNVQQPSYNVAPVTVTTDSSGEFVFNSQECTRMMEYQTGVAQIPFLVQLLQSDTQRVQIAQLMCSFYYRPIGNPGQKSCSSTCRTIWQSLHGYDSTDLQARADRAVLDTFLIDSLLSSGYCDFSPIYSNDPSECYGALDDDTVFRHPNDVTVHKDSCELYPEHSICSGMFTYTYASRSLIQSSSPYYQQYYPRASIDYREQLFGQLKIVYPIAPILPSRCDQSLSKYACSRLYMPCYTVNIPFVDRSGATFTVPYPLLQQSHKSVCEEYADVCRNFISTVATAQYEQAYMFRPDCDGESTISGSFDCDNNHIPGTGLPWHPTTATYDFVGLQVITNNFTKETQPSAAEGQEFKLQQQCPAPLVVPDDLNSHLQYWGACDEPCPTLVFSEDDYNQAGKATLITAIISAACCCFLYLTWFMFAETQSNSNVLPSLFSSTTLTAAILIGTIIMYPRDNSMAKQLCTKSNRQAEMLELPACAVQGFVVLFSLLSLGAWWSLVSIDLFVNLVVGKKYNRFTDSQQRISTIIHHLWGYGIPLLLSLLSCILNSLGPADLDMAYCFVHGREYIWAPWLQTYFPLAVYMLLATICMAWTLQHINQTGLKKRHWGKYATAFMFVFIYFVMFSVIIVYRAVAYFYDPIWLESATQFIECIVLRQYQLNKECGIKPEQTPSSGAWMAVQVIMSGFGIASFLVYGLNRNIYLLWIHKFGTMFNINCCIRAKLFMDNRTEQEKHEEPESVTAASLRGAMQQDEDRAGRISRKCDADEQLMDSYSDSNTDDEQNLLYDDNCGSQLIKGYHDDLSVTTGAARLFYSKVHPRIPRKKASDSRIEPTDQSFLLRAEQMKRVLGDHFVPTTRTSLVKKRLFPREIELLRLLRKEELEPLQSIYDPVQTTFAQQASTNPIVSSSPTFLDTSRSTSLSSTTVRQRPIAREYEDMDYSREDSLISLQEGLDKARFYYGMEEDDVVVSDHRMY